MKKQNLVALFCCIAMLLSACSPSSAYSSDVSPSAETSSVNSAAANTDDTETYHDLIIIGDGEQELLDTLESQSDPTDYLVIDNRDTKAISILFDGNNSVRAVNTEVDKKIVQYECRTVILATGPYSEDNQNLLLPFNRNQNNQLVTDDNGRIHFVESEEAVPTKCGVPLKTEDKEPGSNRADASFSGSETGAEESAPLINGIYVLGSAGDKELSTELINKVLDEVKTDLAK